MKKITRHFAVAALLALLALPASGCANNGSSGPDSERLASLEAEVRTLKLEAQAREKRFKEELARIGKNLDAIRALLEMDDSRAKAVPPKTEPRTENDKLDDEIDTKAKNFVSENLDRLMSITKKLLDKMEQELDEQTKEAEPAPEGEQI